MHAKCMEDIGIACKSSAGKTKKDFFEDTYHKSELLRL
jgi:hypothetical protein